MKYLLVLIIVMTMSCDPYEKQIVQYTYYGTASWKSIENLANVHGQTIPINGILKKRADTYGIFDNSDNNVEYGLMLIKNDTHNIESLVGKQIQLFGTIDTTQNLDKEIYLGAIKVQSIEEKK